MNDREISDFDKLKNTFVELGIEFDILDHYHSFLAIIVLGDYHHTEFLFTSSGQYLSHATNYQID